MSLLKIKRSAGTVSFELEQLDPDDRGDEVDVCLPAARTSDGWSFVDLELDIVRYRWGDVEIRGVDEFRVVRRNSSPLQLR